VDFRHCFSRGTEFTIHSLPPFSNLAAAVAAAAWHNPGTSLPFRHRESVNNSVVIITQDTTAIQCLFMRTDGLLSRRLLTGYHNGYLGNSPPRLGWGRLAEKAHLSEHVVEIIKGAEGNGFRPEQTLQFAGGEDVVSMTRRFQV